MPAYPGTVDWSGENPGMYLKETQDGPFVTLLSFFRVVVSPHGRGTRCSCCGSRSSRVMPAMSA